MVSKRRFFDLCLATLRDFSLLSSHKRFDSLTCAGGNMDPNSCRRVEHWGGLSVCTPNRKTTVAKIPVTTCIYVVCGGRPALCRFTIRTWPAKPQSVALFRVHVPGPFIVGRLNSNIFARPGTTQQNHYIQVGLCFIRTSCMRDGQRKPSPKP